jgi:hypothetical protein
MMMRLKNTVLNQVNVLVQTAIRNQTKVLRVTRKHTSLKIKNASVTMRQPKLENDNTHINVVIMVLVLATQVDE